MEYLHTPHLVHVYKWFTILHCELTFFHRKEQTWSAETVIKVPSKKVEGWSQPEMPGNNFPISYNDAFRTSSCLCTTFASNVRCFGNLIVYVIFGKLISFQENGACVRTNEETLRERYSWCFRNRSLNIPRSYHDLWWLHIFCRSGDRYSCLTG